MTWEDKRYSTLKDLQMSTGPFAGPNACCLCTALNQVYFAHNNGVAEHHCTSWWPNIYYSLCCMSIVWCAWYQFAESATLLEYNNTPATQSSLNMTWQIPPGLWTDVLWLACKTAWLGFGNRSNMVKFRCQSQNGSIACLKSWSHLSLEDIWPCRCKFLALTTLNYCFFLFIKQ